MQAIKKPRQERGFFNGFGVCTSPSHWDLSHSPEHHQNLPTSPPHPGTGDQKKGCDLVNVGGNATDTSHTHPLILMTIHNDVHADQSPCSLTDDELQDVTGGLLLPPGTDFPTSDPGSPLPWWIVLL